MKKEYRVKKSSEIESIIKLRKSVGNKHFVVYKRENHEQSHFRYAVSVSKKFGNAVKRNRIKRQVREIIASLDVVNHVDIFIVVKNEAQQLSFTEIRNSLEWLINKQKLIEVKE